MSSWRPGVVVLVALALGAGGCVGHSKTATQAPTEVRIGLIAGLSGDNRGAGIEAQRGAELAADVVNGLNSLIPLPLANDPGLPNLGNARIRIVTKDVGSNPDSATQAANAVTSMVARQGVAAIIGGYDADVTVKASQRAERIPVPFVNADSSVSFLTERGLDWFFRLGPSARTSGEAFFSLLKQAASQGKPTTKVAVLHATDKAGTDADAVIKELADEGGYDVVADATFEPDQADLGPVVGTIQAAAPDVVFVAPTAKTVPALVKAFADRRYKPSAVMAYGSGYLDSSILKNAGAAVTGVCREVAWSHDLAGRNEAARAVAELYQRKYNASMTEEAADSFTAVLTLAIAINNAGSAQARPVRSALLNLDIPGKDTIMPWAGIQFDETHQNSGAASVVEQFINKAYRVVFPFDAAAGDQQFAYPAPGAPAPGGPTGAAPVG
jgi:branched-chain amino acid transport system substrate-binding protein